MRLAVLVFALAVAAAKKQRTTKDWAKMSDADWDRIESEWETDEEKAEYEYKPPTQRGIDMSKLNDPALKKNPKKMQEMIAESQVSSGASMMLSPSTGFHGPSGVGAKVRRQWTWSPVSLSKTITSPR